MALSSVAACKARSGRDAGASAALAAPQAGGDENVFDYLQPQRVSALMLDEFERFRVRTGASLVSFNMTDVAAISGAYQLELQRLGDGAQQREDRWRIGTDLLPGVLLQDAAGNALPLSVRLRGGRDVVYVRHFEDRNDALRALPKTPLDFPLSAEKALAMAPGDFVSLPVYMGLTLGLEKGTDTQPFVMNARAAVFWHGDFCFNIYRQDGDHVRLKVVPQEARGVSLSTEAGARLDMFGYGPFGLVNLDRQGERLLGLDFFRYSLTHTTHGEKMAVDYVFNLAHPDGRTAYDAVMQRVVTIKAAALAAQGVRGRIDPDTAFSDLTPAEELSVLDERLPPEQKRVARVFRGANFYTGRDVSGRFGTKLLRWEGGTSTTFNWVKAETDRGPEQFVSQQFSTSRKQSSWFSPLRESSSITASSVFSTGADWQVSRFEDLIFNVTVDDSELGANEKNDARAAYRAVFGDYYDNARMDDALAALPGKKFRSRAAVAIHPTLLAKMREVAAADPELYEKQLWYALYLITPRFEGRFGPRSSGEAADPGGILRNFFNNTLQAIRSTARSVVNLRLEGIHGWTSQELIGYAYHMPRYGELAFVDGLFKMMAKDESAQEIVPAFLLMLAQCYQIEAYVELQAQGDGAQPFEAAYGTNSGGDVQQRVGDAFHVLNHLGYER